MSASRYVLINGGAVLNTDAVPNVTPPAPNRIFTFQTPAPGTFNSATNDFVWLAAINGPPTIRYWILAASRWLEFTMQFGATPLVMTSADLGYVATYVPMNAPSFIQVVSPNGCTQITAGTVLG